MIGRKHVREEFSSNYYTPVLPLYVRNPILITYDWFVQSLNDTYDVTSSKHLVKRYLCSLT